MLGLLFRIVLFLLLVGLPIVCLLMLLLSLVLLLIVLLVCPLGIVTRVILVILLIRLNIVLLPILIVVGLLLVQDFILSRFWLYLVKRVILAGALIRLRRLLFFERNLFHGWARAVPFFSLWILLTRGDLIRL